MKTKQIILNIALSILIGFTANNASAQKHQNICQIKANVNCNGCKTKIEENIAFEKGVKDVSASVETKIVIIKYNNTKNSAENLVKAIDKLGYGGKIISDEPYKKDCDGKHTNGKCCEDKTTTKCTENHNNTNCESKETRSKSCGNHTEKE